MTDVEADEPLTIEKIRSIVEELELVKHKSEMPFRAAVLLLSMLVVGDDVKALCDFTGYSIKRGIVQKFVRRAHESGIFKDNILRVEWLDEDAEAANIAFVLDAMVLCGEFERGYDQGITYRMTDQSRDRVEAMGNRRHPHS